MRAYLLGRIRVVPVERKDHPFPLKACNIGNVPPEPIMVR